MDIILKIIRILKKIILYIGNPDIDIAVYGGNQNFKLPYQSKFGSSRVQKPINGTFKDHFIGRYGDDHFIGHLVCVPGRHLEIEEGNVKPSFDVLEASPYKNGDVLSPSISKCRPWTHTRCPIK